MRMCEWLSRTSTEERVGDGSSPRISSSPVSIRLKRFRRVDAERLEHLGGEDFAHAALQRQPAVGGARPGRAAAALGAEIEQPAVRRGRASARTESRARRRVRGCRCGTDGRGSAAPAAFESCPARARSGRNGRSIRRRSARRAPTRSAQRWLRIAQDDAREIAPRRPRRKIRPERRMAERGPGARETRAWNARSSVGPDGPVAGRRQAIKPLSPCWNRCATVPAHQNSSRKHPIAARAEGDPALMCGRMADRQFDLDALPLAADLKLDTARAGHAAAGRHGPCDAAAAPVEQVYVMRTEIEKGRSFRNIGRGQPERPVGDPQLAVFDLDREGARIPQ